MAEPSSAGRERFGVASEPTMRLSAPVLDLIGGLLFLATALWLWFGAASIEDTGQGLNGPAGFPRGVAILLGGSALMLVIQGAAALSGRRQERPVTVQRPMSVLAAIILVILYPFLLHWLGYYAATGLWLLPFFWISGCRSPLLILGCSVGFLVFTKVLFETVLGTPLP